MQLTRRVLIPLALVAGLWALAWSLTSALAPRLVRQVLPTVQGRLESVGLGLGDVTFSGIRVSPWLNGLVISDVQAQLDLDPRDRIRLRSRLEIDTLEVRLTQPLALRGTVHADGIELRLDPADRPPQLPFERLADAGLTIGDLPFGRPRLAASEIRDKLRDLFSENEAIGEVEFSGEVVLDVEGTIQVARLYTERSGEAFRLRFREDDIRAIAEAKGMGLVSEQIEIVSLYPMRAPVILLLTDRARSLATQHAADDAWLHDAMRHVIWSFLLTRTFGPEFATKVTDAQELRPGNTPDERAMDFHNNAIGRRLAAEAVPLDTLPGLVRVDRDVIRHPEEVARFGEDRLLR